MVNAKFKTSQSKLSYAMKELSLIGIKKNAGADAKFKTSHSKHLQKLLLLLYSTA